MGQESDVSQLGTHTNSSRLAFIPGGTSESHNQGMRLTSEQNRQLTEMFLRHAGYLTTVVNKATGGNLAFTQDIVAETFYRVAIAIIEGLVIQDSGARNMLHTVGINLFSNWSRLHENRNGSLEEMLEEGIPTERFNGPRGVDSIVIERDRIRAAFEDISDTRIREILFLRLQGFELQEICDMLDISLAKAKRLSPRGVRELRDGLRAYDSTV